MEKAAKQSCKDKAAEERRLSNLTASDNDLVDAAVGYDGAWQKRGLGHYSPAGIGHAMGTESKGIFGYSTRNKKCLTCDAATRRGDEPKKHDCRRNWHKSAQGHGA